MKLTKLKGPVLVALGCVILIGLLIVSGRLTNELLFVLGGIAAIALWKGQTDPHLINMWEAEQIARKTTEKKQLKFDIESGEISTTKARMRWRLISDEEHTKRGTRVIQSFEPYKWGVVVVIEGAKSYGYLCELDRHGVLIGFNPIPAPMLHDLLEQPDIYEFKGREKPGQRIRGEEYDEE